MPNPAAVVALLAAASCAPVAAQDPVETDAAKYRVILDNECVRVFDYADQPGEKTHMHRHPPFVVYALAPFKRRLTLPDGKVLTREFKPGDVLFSPAQTHVGENIGELPTRALIVELKPGRGEVCSAR